MNTLIKLNGYKRGKIDVDKVYYACIPPETTPETYLEVIHKGIVTGYYYTISGKAETDIETFGIFGWLTRIKAQPELVRKIKEMLP